MLQPTSHRALFHLKEIKITSLCAEYRNSRGPVDWKFRDAVVMGTLHKYA